MIYYNFNLKLLYFFTSGIKFFEYLNLNPNLKTESEIELLN